MVRSHIRLALIAGLGAILAGCVTVPPPATSAAGWRQISAGVGEVMGETKYDAKLAKEADKLYQYCNVMRPVATGVSIFSPEEHQRAAQIASSVVATVCDRQPRSVREALATAIAAYAEIVLLLANKNPAPS